MEKVIVDQTFGFKYLRYLCVAYMIHIHSFVWVSFAYERVFYFTHFPSLIKILILSGSFMPLMLPVIAGAGFRIYRKESDKDNSDFIDAARLFLLLYFLGLGSRAISFGYRQWFGWDVLPLVGASLLIISIIPRNKRRVVLPGIILANYVLFWLKDKILTLKVDDFLFSNSMFFSFFNLVTFLAILYYLEKKAKRKIPFMTLGILAVGIYLYNTEIVTFREILVTLYRDTVYFFPSNFRHWQIIPWSTLVLWGYWIFDVILSFNDYKKARMFLMILLVLFVTIFIWKGAGEYYSSFSENEFWASKLFANGPFALFGILGAFVLHLFWTDVLERKVKWELKWLTITGQNVLPIYLILVSAPIIDFPKNFRSLGIKYEEALVLYAVSLNILFILGSVLLGKKKFRFKIKKVMRENS